jgi:hypothetical protein
MSTRHGSGNEPAASFFDRPVITAAQSQGRIAYCLSNTLVRQTVTTSDVRLGVSAQFDYQIGNQD